MLRMTSEFEHFACSGVWNPLQKVIVGQYTMAKDTGDPVECVCTEHSIVKQARKHHQMARVGENF